MRTYARDQITVVIPHLDSRGDLLNQALASVRAQSRLPERVIIETSDGQGAWDTRNRGLDQVETEWTAFLDDDDLFLPHHLEFLYDAANEDGYDLVWGWFRVLGGEDPFPNHRGRQFNPSDPHIFPITVLGRTKFLHRALENMGGFQPDPEGSGNWMIQDCPVWKYVYRDGATLHGYNDITWQWRHHGANTSGVPATMRG